MVAMSRIEAGSEYRRATSSVFFKPKRVGNSVGFRYLEGERNICTEATMQAREKSVHTEVSSSHMGYLHTYDSCIKYSYLIQEFNRSQVQIKAGSKMTGMK